MCRITKKNKRRTVVCQRCHNILRDVPASTYVVNDEAFELSKNLITPFTGSLRAHQMNDSFIFFLNQVRNRIEMSIARLRGKLGLLYV